jgi:hypothetical protein
LIGELRTFLFRANVLAGVRVGLYLQSSAEAPQGTNQQITRVRKTAKADEDVNARHNGGCAANLDRDPELIRR